MSKLTDFERRHYDAINQKNPHVNPDLVGDILGVGGESLVRRYGEGQVIKSPLPQVVRLDCSLRSLYAQTFGKILAADFDTARRSFDLCQEYVGEKMVETEIPGNVATGDYSFIQDELDYKELTFKMHAEDSHVQQQFAEIMDGTRKMLHETGYLFDAMGYDLSQLIHFWRTGEPYIKNIAVIRSEIQQLLRLFDFGIFAVKKSAINPRSLLHRTGLDKKILNVQTANMKKFGHDLLQA